MEVAVVGDPKFVLGFKLAGVRKTYPVALDRLEQTVTTVAADRSVGILVVDNTDWVQLPAAFRRKMADSVQPVVISIGKVEEEDLRERIKQAVGVDLWK